jgi:uncharacterized protein YbjT (DUF2867 family)
MASILVTGGTGTLGRLVVPRLQVDGNKVRVLSRSSRTDADGIEYVTGDLSTGEGVEAAVQGAEVVVHCAGTAKGDDEKARNLVPALSRAGVQHIVFISVVGADRVTITSGLDRAMFGYFGAKLAAEQAIADSGVPWTTLRATQFYDTMLTTLKGMAKLPVIPAPSGFRFQPIDTGEVATRLAELALGKPAGLVPEMGGPKAYLMADLIRSYLKAAHKHRLLLPAVMPGKAAKATKAGANLTPDHAVGKITWEEFLAAHVS